MQPPSRKEHLMSSTVAGLSFDCADADAVARFWADALGREIVEHPTEQNAVVSVGVDPAFGPRLAFHQVPGAKTVKNRLHMDLITTDFDVESARLTPG
jgi:hypothetical protein